MLTPHRGQVHERSLKIVAAFIARLARQRGQTKPNTNTPMMLIRRKPRMAIRK
jgi:hypothetical protein